MYKNQLWQFLSFSTIFLVLFFLLVINVNFYAGSLIQQNSRLQSQKQTLENRLQTTRLTSNTDLEREIQKNLEVGTILRINNTQSINILDIQTQPSQNTAQETPPQVIPSANPSVTIR